MEKTIGRSNECDIVILDPKNRVSRFHAKFKSQGNEHFLKDEGSSNGTYINGKRIPTGQFVLLRKTDKVTLSKDYNFDFKKYIVVPPSDETLILNTKANDQTVIFEANRVTVHSNDKTVMFDPQKTGISDLSKLDNSPFKKIGRSNSCDIVISNNNISREHCKIRMLTPQIIEVEDLNSANGTYADGKKLDKNKTYKFGSSVRLNLSNEYSLNLKEVFSDIKIIPKPSPNKKHAQKPNPRIKEPITEDEMQAFMELEEVWNEFNNRNQKANKLASGYGIGGAAVGLAAMAFMPAGGFIVSAGIGVIGRYIGQQKSNEIRSDLSFENMFLEVYSCPRCKESFQRKPWITIRDCFKCKLTFR
jgi:pSer/pThr/pTyr-binding forkhead associated (FHA) protein